MSTNTLEGGCFFGTGTNTYKAALVSKLNLHVNLANHRQTPTTEGLTTWRTIPHAAVLNKNYRCSTDYALFLSNFRNGFVSQIHLDKLNSRCLRHHPTILSEAEWQQAPFIIPYNAIRINFNVQSVEARASVETPVHWIIAEDRAGNLSPATIAKLQYQNRDLSDTETSDLPTLLPLQEGHEYIVTNNLGPELNISKSTKCTLVRISYPSGYHPPTGPTLLVKRKITPCRNETRLPRQTTTGMARSTAPFTSSQSTSKMARIHRRQKRNYFSHSAASFHSHVIQRHSRKSALCIGNKTSILFGTRRRFHHLPLPRPVNGQSSNHPYHGKKQRLSFNEIYTILSRARSFESLILIDDDIPRATVDVKPSSDIVAEIHRIQSLAHKTENEIWNYFPVALHTFYSEMVKNCKE
ncbi:hypothetical protein BC829DRAFT_421263 [Chytridium lagenaria]|nr:hypothetical protein BC829DRAFT_421263 [Chytridium lagenaria]